MKKNFERSLLVDYRPLLLDIRKVPKQYKDDISKLYSFIYITSKYTDKTTQDSEGLKYIVRRWQAIKKDNLFGQFTANDDSINERILSNITYLVHRYDVDVRDVDSYLRSVAIKLRHKNIVNSQDFVRYLNYSAEAPALIVTKLLQLPNALAHHAKLFARSIHVLGSIISLGYEQYEDSAFFPKSELKKYGLESLEKKEIMEKPEEFKNFIQLQLKRYRAWQDESKKGDEFLPKKLKPVIKHARASCDYLAYTLEKDPMSIFQKNIKKPSRINIKLHAIKGRK